MGKKKKTHKASAKRFKKKKGRLIHRKSGKNHLRSKKSSARKRRLARLGEVFGSYKKSILKKLK